MDSAGIEGVLERGHQLGGAADAARRRTVALRIGYEVGIAELQGPVGEPGLLLLSADHA